MTAFLASTEKEAVFAAQTSGSPTPYDEFLGGLRVQRRDGEARLCFSEDRWLELSEPVEELQGFAEKLLVTEEQGHRHWYGVPVSLILEADNYYPEELSNR
jgi:hypothetical protein